MTFIRRDANPDKIADEVFTLSQKAKEDQDPGKIDATIGSILDESGELVAFKSVFETFDALDDKDKARYADNFEGNKDYLEAVYKHVLEDQVNLPHRLVATSGGTGAITLAFKNILERGDHVLLPHIAWGAYKTIGEDHALKVTAYNAFDVDDLILKAHELCKSQDKLLIVINSPCHNPTGFAFDLAMWDKLIKALEATKKPCVILNDIAYLDYTYDLKKGREYLKLFNEIGTNTMVIIAFSLSKTFTSYGLRTGADIILARNREDVDALANVFERSCRALWSNVNNAAMMTFAKVMRDKREEFLLEKDSYIKMLKKRSDLFLKELDAYHIPYYPYNDGFFITLSFKDNQKRDSVHELLLKRHVYTLRVNLGIRIAICSVPFNKLKDLSLILKEVLAK